MSASDGDILAVRVAGARSILVDAKDRALSDALAMLGSRLAELSEELGPALPLPPDALPLLARLCSTPLDLAFGVDEGPESEVPFYAQLTLHAGTPEAAAGMSADVLSLAAALGEEVPPRDEHGLHPIPAPIPAWFGSIASDFVVAVGRTVDEPLELGVTHLPAGVEPALAFRLDVGRLVRLAESFAAGEPEAAEMFELFELFGLADARITWAMGNDAERAYAVTSMEGAVPGMRELGLLPDAPISRRSFAAVPADAVWAMVGPNNLRSALRLVRRVAGDAFSGASGEGADPIEALAASTGIHLERDLLDHLGTSLGAYASDTTGGGGLASTVLFAEVGEEAALAETTARIEGLLNELALAEAQGYVQIRVRTSDGLRYSTLTFPGLPIPVEPTWTIASGFFLLGLSPQAAEAAARQVSSGAASLADQPRLLEQLPEGLDGLYGLSYLDTPRLVRDGYGWVSLACSALANAVRSRSDPSRDAGAILPPYPELVRGAKAWVSATRVVGEDVVETARFDRSMLVNAAGLAGFLQSLPFLLSAPALLLGTASQVASETFLPAPEPVDVAGGLRGDLIMLHYAAAEYAVLNDGQYPSDLELLFVPDENGYAFVADPDARIDPWGQPFLYEPPAAEADAPRIYSLGSDGLPGGEGDAADFDNFMLLEELKQKDR